MQESTKQALLGELEHVDYSQVLDAPAGGGWLSAALRENTDVDGIDLYVQKPSGYRRFWEFDLDEGLPADCRGYDLICCCEGLEHVGNPLKLLRHFNAALKDEGLLIITTPNVWYPQSRLQYFFRGFFPSFPSLAGKVKSGTHMHITPWTYPQLYIYLKMSGFNCPKLIPEQRSRAKHFHEVLMSLPAKLYCMNRLKKARDEEERKYWRQAGAQESLVGRHLIAATTKQL